MRLGLNLGYWDATGGAAGDDVALARAAERLGFSVIWVAEAYGSDAPTVLSWIAARTTSIEVGSAVMQIPARTPAMTAMTAATLDRLSGGRFRLGLGVSGPQVSEGWHGVRFDRPLERTREYVEIVRRALRRERLRYEGAHYTLPLPDGPGKALTLTVHPVREPVPLYLAAVGPRNIELAGEIADGWLAIFFSPEHAADHLAGIAAGRARATAAAATDPTPAGGFDIAASVPVVIGADPRRAADPVRGYAALYLGGMGSRTSNFYNALAVRMGYGRAAAEIQDRFLARDYAAAAAAVPWEFLDATALLGPVERVAERICAYAEAGVTTLSVLCPGGELEERLNTLRDVARAAELAGVIT